MRVLFSTTAGSSHFGPLIPFARACVEAGHEVEVAAPASFADAVARAGFTHAPFDDAPPALLGQVFARVPDLSFEEANRAVIADVFGRLDAQAALPGVTRIIERWRPDVVVHEPCELGSLAAAARAGIPVVRVAIGLAAMDEVAVPILEVPLAELSRLAGLPHDAGLRAMAAAPTFTCVPAELDDIDPERRGAEPSGELASNAPVWRFHDPAVFASTGSIPAAWGDPDAPLVYVSFGSVAGALATLAPIYRTTLDALADAPVRVLLTTGDAGDHGSLGVLPDNAHVERWWPQADVMPHAAAVVGHGGFGTTMAALAAGVPQVVVPLFAFDQVVNADRVAAVGAGIRMPIGVGGCAALGPAVRDILADPSYRVAAGSVARDIAVLPAASTAVPLLEQMSG